MFVFMGLSGTIVKLGMFFFFKVFVYFFRQGCFVFFRIVLSLAFLLNINYLVFFGLSQLQSVLYSMI